MKQFFTHRQWIKFATETLLWEPLRANEKCKEVDKIAKPGERELDGTDYLLAMPTYKQIKGEDSISYETEISYDGKKRKLSSMSADSLQQMEDQAANSRIWRPRCSTALAAAQSQEMFLISGHGVQGRPCSP